MVVKRILIPEQSFHRKSSSTGKTERRKDVKESARHMSFVYPEHFDSSGKKFENDLGKNFLSIQQDSISGEWSQRHLR